MPLEELCYIYKERDHSADGGYAEYASSNDDKYDLGLSVHGNH